MEKSFLILRVGIPFECRDKMVVSALANKANSTNKAQHWLNFIQQIVIEYLICRRHCS